MSAHGRGPGYRPAEDALIREACASTRAERIRAVAAELGRSETAIRRRWQRLTRGGAAPAGNGTRYCPDIDPRDPWNRVLDAALAGCGVRLSLADCEALTSDAEFRRRAVDARIAAALDAAREADS